MRQIASAVHLDLHHAARAGQFDAASAFVSAGFDVNAFDGEAWTPLHCAAYNAHIGGAGRSPE